jgi:hypothetical protein
LWREIHNHRIDVFIGQNSLYRHFKTRRLSIADNVDRIAVLPIGGQHLIQFLDGFRV